MWYVLAVLVMLPGAASAAVEWPFDMRVERVEEVGGAFRVTTTGGGFELRPAEDLVLLVQRIGGRRWLGTVEVGGLQMAGLRVTEQDDQHVLLVSDAGFRYEVTCDSALRLTCPPDFETYLPVDVWTSHQPDFKPEYFRNTREGTLILDERGGLGLFPLFGAQGRPFAQNGRIGCHLQMPVPPGESLAVCVCPARPYNWKQHSQERIVHQFPELAVPGDSPRPLPTDEELVEWRKMGNVLVLHLEFWDGFGVQHIRPKDPARFREVVSLAHKLGFLVVPYSSTYYYTPAVEPGGKLRDDAVDLYMEEAKWLLDEYGVDGLYWDGVFADVGKAWECARRMRALLGSRRLYVHCTTLPLWDPDLPVPFVDTWADYLLRGEGLGREHIDPIYLRYVASGYNISNAIGELCYETCRVDQAMFDWALEANVRLPYWPGRQVHSGKQYFLHPEEDALFRDTYVPAADRVADARAYSELAASGSLRRQARREDLARARAAAEAELVRYLLERKSRLLGEYGGNLAAFRGGECSDYCDRPEGLHGLGYRVEYATDQNPDTYWAADHPPQWLTIDLGEVETISKVRVTNYFGDARYYHYQVEVSTDNRTWTKVGEKMNDALATAEGDLHEFPPVPAQYVRVTMLHDSANWGQHVVEIGVWR